MKLGPDRQCQLSAKPSSVFVLTASGRYRGTTDFSSDKANDSKGSAAAGHKRTVAHVDCYPVFLKNIS